MVCRPKETGDLGKRFPSTLQKWVPRFWVVSVKFRTFYFSVDEASGGTWFVGLGSRVVFVPILPNARRPETDWSLAKSVAPTGGRSVGSCGLLHFLRGLFLQPLHVQIPARSPLRSRDVPQPRNHQDQRAVPVRKGSHHPCSASNFLHDPPQRGVRPDAAVMLPRKGVVAQRLIDASLMRWGSSIRRRRISAARCIFTAMCGPWCPAGR